MLRHVKLVCARIVVSANLFERWIWHALLHDLIDLQQYLSQNYNDGFTYKRINVYFISRPSWHVFTVQPRVSSFEPVLWLHHLFALCSIRNCSLLFCCGSFLRGDSLSQLSSTKTSTWKSASEMKSLVVPWSVVCFLFTVQCLVKFVADFNTRFNSRIERHTLQHHE